LVEDSGEKNKNKGSHPFQHFLDPAPINDGNP
jgi:hypothetical protein